MDLGLRGLRVLVTGGSAGIGLASAAMLVREGAAVAIASRRPEQAAAGVGAAGIACDLATADGAATAVGQAVDRLGGLDVLVNNVGAAVIRSFDELSDDDWRH